MQRPYRVVVAEIGSDPAASFARALRDAGFEVIVTGRDQSPEQVAETALQEDADAVGIAGSPTELPRVTVALEARGLDDVLLFSEDDVTDTAWLAAALDGRQDAA